MPVLDSWRIRINSWTPLKNQYNSVGFTDTELEYDVVYGGHGSS